MGLQGLVGYDSDYMGTSATDKYQGTGHSVVVDILMLRQKGHHFADKTFKCIFVNENVRILTGIPLKCVPMGPVNNNPALAQIMAWHRPGDKPLSEPRIVRLLTHICITRPQCV